MLGAVATRLGGWNHLSLFGLNARPKRFACAIIVASAEKNSEEGDKVWLRVENEENYMEIAISWIS